MRVAAAKAEGVHRDQRRSSFKIRQGRESGGDAHAVQGQQRIRRLKMEIRWDRPLLKHKHRFDESRQARC